jgi:hypothetical protein
MKNLRWTVALFALALTVAAEIPTHAQGRGQAVGQRRSSAVTVPAAGTFAEGGQFTGNITINRFEQRGNQIVAIGAVTGVLSRGGQTLGSVLAAEVTWPVVARVGGQVLASGPARKGAQITPVSYAAEARPPAATLIAQDGCQIVNLALGPHTIDVLGIVLTLDPVAINLTGAAGTALGDLVCAVVDLIGNVAGLVNVLNGILGLLTGLLGGLTGGLG